MFPRVFLLLFLFGLCLALKKPRVNGGEGGTRTSAPDEKNEALRGTKKTPKAHRPVILALRGTKKTPKVHRPVVLVPGLGGSQLWANLTGKRSVPYWLCAHSTKRYFNIWLSLVLLLPKVIDCTIDNLRLHYDAPSHTTRNTQGVDIQALHFGDPQSVEWLDPFFPIAAQQQPLVHGGPKDRGSSGGNGGSSRVVPFTRAEEVHRRGVENSASSASASILLGARPSQQQTTMKWMREEKAQRVRGFLSDLSYYADISKALVSNGYTRGKDLVATPYDFRKAPNELGEFFNKTKRLIEDTFSRNNGTRVVLVAHSMGNPVMLYFYNRVVSQRWKDRYVHAHVALAAPWGGAVKALQLMVTGDSLGLIYVKTSAVRTFQRSMPSVAWLLPSQPLWSGDEPLVTTPQRNYTASQYGQLFADLGYADGYSMWKDTKGLTSGLKFPGIEMHVLYGTSVNTTGRLVYSGQEFPDHTPQVMWDDGDGTVNRRSLEAFKKWQTHTLTQQHSGGTSRPVKSLALPRVTHLGILKDPRAIQYVLQVALQ